MGDEQIKVIHVDTEKSWRGGQQQTVYLLEGMLAKGYETLLVCQPASALEAYCQAHKLPYQALCFSSEIDIPSGYALARIARRSGAQILQLHSGHAVSWGLWAKLFSPSLKLVATRRVDFSIRKNLFSIFKYQDYALNQIVCISENIRNVLLKDGISGARLSIIRSGIDIRRFDHDMVPSGFRQTWNIPSDHLLIGTVAAFAGHKDYPNLLQAASIVLQHRKDITFMAVGDGLLLPAMKKLAMDLSIQDNFIFAGFQKNVGEYLKAFNIFVLASKLEGLGTSVLDAMSVGLPIIGTRAGGIPEMLRHNENGLLVPAQNPQALAEAIIELADNPIKRASLALEAQSDIFGFSNEEMVKQYIKLYEKLLV